MYQLCESCWFKNLQAHHLCTSHSKTLIQGLAHTLSMYLLAQRCQIKNFETHPSRDHYLDFLTRWDIKWLLLFFQLCLGKYNNPGQFAPIWKMSPGGNSDILFMYKLSGFLGFFGQVTVLNITKKGNSQFALQIYGVLQVLWEFEFSYETHTLAMWETYSCKYFQLLGTLNRFNSSVLPYTLQIWMYL